MSSGALRRRALALAESSGLFRSARDDIGRVLMHLGKDAPLQFLYDLAHARLDDRALALDRAATCALFLACGNWLDDLADGDLAQGPGGSRFAKRAPGAGLLVYALALDTTHRFAPEGALSWAVQRLPQVIAAQQEELRDAPWNVDRYRAVAEGFAALQYQLYGVILAGPEDQPLQTALGALGVAGMVISDIIDPSTERFFTLARDDQQVVLKDAYKRCRPLIENPLWPIARVAKESAQVLKDALGADNR